MAANFFQFAPYMHGQGSATGELSLYAEFKISSFSFWASPLLLVTLVILGSFLLVYSARKMTFLLNFYCICAATTMIVLLLGKSRRSHSMLVTCPKFYLSPKTSLFLFNIQIELFFCLCPEFIVILCKRTVC